MKDLTKLKYGIITSQAGFTDGVSIVMKQVEDVMIKNLNIAKSQIFYLVGKSKNISPKIRQREVLWHRSKEAMLANKQYSKGLKLQMSKKIEKAIIQAQKEIEYFIKEKEIDVIFGHNTSHPVNFILSVALSRYYRENVNTPKYIVWWHDSHLERKRYKSPAPKIKKYLYEGVPGKYVDYIIFINSIQPTLAQKYFTSFGNDFENKILKHSVVIHNTVDQTIEDVNELNQKNLEKTKTYLDKYKVNHFLKNKKLKLDDCLFCIQHTRIVARKRIDFALEYAYKILVKMKQKKQAKCLVFLVTGEHGDEIENYKKEIININNDFQKKYDKNVLLIFAEDYDVGINFEEFPQIISKLGGFATFFSEVEGFGNNLLEVLSAGLIPVVYKYPVYISDIEKYGFKLLTFDNYKITNKKLEEIINLLSSSRKRKIWANENLRILKKHFTHETITEKLKKAIL